MTDMVTYGNIPDDTKKVCSVNKVIPPFRMPASDKIQRGFFCGMVSDDPYQQTEMCLRSLHSVVPNVGSSAQAEEL